MDNCEYCDTLVLGGMRYTGKQSFGCKPQKWEKGKRLLPNTARSDGSSITVSWHI